MIFGDTPEVRREREREKRWKKYEKERIVFAWWPVKLTNGQYAWLEFVNRQFWFWGPVTGDPYYHYTRRV